MKMKIFAISLVATWALTACTIPKQIDRQASKAAPATGAYYPPAPAKVKSVPKRYHRVAPRAASTNFAPVSLNEESEEYYMASMPRPPDEAISLEMGTGIEMIRNPLGGIGRALASTARPNPTPVVPRLTPIGPPSMSMPTIAVTEQMNSPKSDRYSVNEPQEAGNPFVATGKRATRLFAGPGEYPPKIYAAYGIVAFWDRIDPTERNRYEAICLAYLRSLDPAPAGMAAEKQMVTVWPVTSGTVAKDLMSGPSFQTFDMNSQCNTALNNYDFQVGREAIRMARLQSKDVDGRGPYLLAWSPTDKIGTDKAIILMADLSKTENFFAAREIFRIWIKEIESDLDLWNDGFTWDRLQRKLKALVDTYGAQIEGAFKAKQ